MINVKASMLSSRVQAGLPSRWSGSYGSANPVGNPAATTRLRASLSTNAPPTVQHPKLNTTPWSTSYAQTRRPLRASASKKARKG
jgi:hypothetical protein